MNYFTSKNKLSCESKDQDIFYPNEEMINSVNPLKKHLFFCFGNKKTEKDQPYQD